MYLDAAADAIAAGQVTALDVVGFPRHLERLIVTPRAGISSMRCDFLAHSWSSANGRVTSNE